MSEPAPDDAGRPERQPSLADRAFDLFVFAPAGAFVASSPTASDGTYALGDLLAGSYRVCFEPASGNYVSRCAGDVAWRGTDGVEQISPPPAGATASSVASGRPR